MQAVSSIAALGILSAFGGGAMPERTSLRSRVMHTYGNGGRELRRRRARNKVAGRSRAANRR